jgi:chromate transporter
MKDYLSLFITFLRIGLFTIGGGPVMLPLIQRIVTEDKKWMTEAEIIDCFAVCQTLPGVIAINTAIYIGKTRKGFGGAIAAALGIMTPSFVIIILAVTALDAIGDNSYISGAFTGIKAASCGLILYTAFKMGKQVMRGKLTWAIAALSFIMIVFFRITAIWAICAGAAAGLLYMKYRESKEAS